MRMGLNRRYPRRQKLYIFPKRRGRPNYVLVWMLVLGIIVFLCTVILSNMAPAIEALAESKSNYMAMKIINETINKKISESGIQYADLVTMQKSSDGNITAIQSNTFKMNQLKAIIANSIQDQLAALDVTQIGVRLGSITNNKLLAAMGPTIPVKIAPAGLAEVDFKSSFTSAGINQTKHEIYLEVKVTISILMPVVHKSTVVTTNMPVCSTVIVGAVPQGYVNIDGLAIGKQ